jgi:hypothetical protein
MAEADKGAASGVRLGVGRARATRAWHACAQPRERDRDSAAGAREMFVPPCDDDAGTRGAAPRHACRDPLLPFPRLISAPRIRAHAAFFADPRPRRVRQRVGRARPGRLPQSWGPGPGGIKSLLPPREAAENLTVRRVCLVGSSWDYSHADRCSRDPDARHQSCAPPHASLLSLPHALPKPAWCLSARKLHGCFLHENCIRACPGEENMRIWCNARVRSSVVLEIGSVQECRFSSRILPTRECRSRDWAYKVSQFKPVNT